MLDHLVEPRWRCGVQCLGRLYDPPEPIRPFRHIPTLRGYVRLRTIDTWRKLYHRPVFLA